MDFRDDPPLLANGECAMCPRQRPSVGRDRDPFCSSACARRYYGVIFLDRTGRNIDDPRKGHRKNMVEALARA